MGDRQQQPARSRRVLQDDQNRSFGPTGPDWLVWLTDSMRQAMDLGLDMNETVAQPLPTQYRSLSVARDEYRRSVGHLFPKIEAEALNKPPAR
ncbi:hypothetical protein [Sphingobium sp. EP60837]|uniref:hypothetical protein n=1 Tax=Sphingobium sp. EP60837 TaxID=1855519 RepID=UPI0012E8336B|nr:hypothetical protein [Sphingobium sp. EP60837]